MRSYHDQWGNLTGFTLWNCNAVNSAWQQHTITNEASLITTKITNIDPKSCLLHYFWQMNRKWNTSGLCLLRTFELLCLPRVWMPVVTVFTLTWWDFHLPQRSPGGGHSEAISQRCDSSLSILAWKDPFSSFPPCMSRVTAWWDLLLLGFEINLSWKWILNFCQRTAHTLDCWQTWLSLSPRMPISSTLLYLKTS